MDERLSQRPDFDRDVISAASGSATSQEDLRGIITAVARASHEIADLVSLGELATPARNGTERIDIETTPAARARQILIGHLTLGPVKTLYCAGDGGPIRLNESGLYVVTIDPLEGTPDADANLPFGTIFSIAPADDVPSRDANPPVAGFIHYGPQTNLVLAMGTGVHIFYLDRPARTYRLAAENIRVPEDIREWAIDATKRGRWSPMIRSLIDEQLEEADAPGSMSADIRWTGSLTADAYRILRRGGIYLCPQDDQPGREDTCPSLRHAARPIALVIERAGGRATTGYGSVTDAEPTNARTPLIFGSRHIVERIERLHALPDSTFEKSPLFGKRGLFRL